MKTKILKILFIFAITLFATNTSANGCSFYRDLWQGTRGEDVRCLQQHLTSFGYGLSPDGVYGQMTNQAVTSWQMSNGLPVSGYFDANSRARYFEQVSFGGISGGGSVLGAYTTGTDYNPSIDSLEVRARDRIEDALIMIEDAEDEIDDSNQNTSSAENSLEDAKEDIIESVRAFFIDRDFREAYDLADDALKNAEDAFEDVDGDGNRGDAEDTIDDARDAINDAEDEIADADDDGDDVDEAEDILEEAEDRLDEAEEEFDDRNYDEAEDLAKEAEELARDAVNAID